MSALFSQFPHSSCIVISSWASVRLALFVVWSLHFSVDILKLPFTWRWYLFSLSRLRNVKFIFLFCQVSREHRFFSGGSFCASCLCWNAGVLPLCLLNPNLLNQRAQRGSSTILCKNTDSWKSCCGISAK